MKGYFSESRSVEAVNERMSEETDPRLEEIMGKLVTHIHAFVKQVNLTEAEWMAGIEFLTRTGRICSDERQEFILLSDTLGLSMLVDAISNRRPDGATENTVFGPFHVKGAPEYEMGKNISLDGKGESCLFEGTIKDLQGAPIEGAELDVWSDNADGYYDVQQPDVQPKWNNRGRFITGPDGCYSFRGIKPVSYPIPSDGPVGQMLTALGRHPYRPAHMHLMVTREGFQTIVSHSFVEGDPYLADDTVFGVKQSLVASFERTPDAEGDTVWRSRFDIVMARLGEDTNVDLRSAAADEK
ncbi:intradiol ring-cleavage dioxygenase [uncultured Roseobacter sp.]|uniref:intradiol ring-cleavage dioxygenase n=1 Tax=uncultured Roseobacter sp. TaxID=114847 RepID=UPI00262C8053|nr:intradiol ring-cleavage dioxygenase [uncultured Roseobacter sp.]